MTDRGTFVISLDFELFWGVHDFLTLEEYGAHIQGAASAIEGMLELFSEYGIHSTFATVGFLFAENKKTLFNALPTTQPQYTKQVLSPYYKHIEGIGESEEDDPYHFAYTLLQKIQRTPNQEIGSHTFSHYYCLEDGQDLNSFKADLEAAKASAQSVGIELKSLVFPRNQYNETYLEACKEAGISSYRGNEQSWIYRPESREKESLFKRLNRLMDSYVNLSGHHTFRLKDCADQTPFNIPSSRFLRPYSSSLRFFEGLKLRRIKNSMTQAAKNNQVYHLWWHPHNFGQNEKENLQNLRQILEHYKSMEATHQFQSLNMVEISNMLSSS